jgi:hypothetical protein
MIEKITSTPPERWQAITIISNPPPDHGIEHNIAGNKNL